jgi:hypothetical protein
MASFLEIIIIIMMIRAVVNLVCREKNITTLNKNETIIYPVNNELLIYPVILNKNYSFQNYNEKILKNISFLEKDEIYVM